MKKAMMILALFAFVYAAQAQGNENKTAPTANGVTKATPVMQASTAPAGTEPKTTETNNDGGHDPSKACCQKAMKDGKSCCQGNGSKAQCDKKHGGESKACCKKDGASASGCSHHSEEGKD